MGYQMPERLAFLESALQGLAFWIGHRRAYYSSYPLSESALVTEACNLIQAKLPTNLILRPEILYRRVFDATGTEIPDKARADLVILDSSAPDPYKSYVGDAVHFLFEVKRGGTSTKLINDDLRRLHAFKSKCRPEARAFFILASESSLPERFVDSEKGESKLHAHPIPGTKGVFHVRRTVKAAASFRNKKTAHYVSIAEVFSNSPARNEISKF